MGSEELEESGTRRRPLALRRVSRCHSRHLGEVVPGLVELEVAVPRLRPAVW